MIATRLLGGGHHGGRTLPVDCHDTEAQVFATLGYPSMSRMEPPCVINPFPGEATQ